LKKYLYTFHETTRQLQQRGLKHNRKYLYLYILSHHPKDEGIYFECNSIWFKCNSFEFSVVLMTPFWLKN